MNFVILGIKHRSFQYTKVPTTFTFDTGLSNLNNVDSANKYMGVRITNTALRNKELTQVVFSLKKQASPTGNATVECRKVSDNSLVGTSDALDTSTLSTSYSDHTFNFSSVIAPNEDFRLLYNHPNATGANYTIMSGTGSGKTDDGAVETYSTTGPTGTYTDDSSQDPRGSVTYLV